MTLIGVEGGWSSSSAGAVEADRARSAGPPLTRLLAGTTMLLVALGVLMVFSAGGGPADGAGFGLRQALFAGVGVVAMAVASRIDHRRWWRVHRLILLGTVIALAAVLTPLGTEVRGTRGWFRFGSVSIQPSEFAKLTLILLLAIVLSGRNTDVDRGHGRNRPTVPGPTQFTSAIMVLGLLAALVVAQGEAGTVLVFCAIGLGMLTAAGTEVRYLLLLIVSGIAVVGLTLSLGLLAPYQVDRFEAFLDADLDPQGVGYNQHQALTAIGSGGLTGTGLFDGPQTQLGYLPDQHTDFIFAAVAEELGFVGALTVIGLEVAVAALVLLIGADTTDRFGRLLCVGVFSMIAFQVFQNVGMNLRLMPITGIALPFVSYGGSSLLTSMLGVGLVLGVGADRSRTGRYRAGTGNTGGANAGTHRYARSLR